MTGQRRLADDRVPRRPTAGRSSAAPTSRTTTATGMPGVRARAATRSTRRGATGATSSTEQAEQLTERDRRSTRCGRRAARGALDARRSSTRASPASAQQFDAALRRLRPRAEVPAGDDASTSCCDARRAQRRAPRRSRWSPTTLDAMAAGGIYDQVGGGFAPLLGRRRTGSSPTSRRCSTTRRCSPARTCTAGWSPARRATGASSRRRRLRAARPAPRRRRLLLRRGRRLRGRRGQVLRAGRSTRSREVCGDDAAEVDRATSASPRGGNFEDPHTGFRGNILHVVDRAEDRPTRSSAARAALFAAREHRVRPGLDDKVLLGWNALFLARAGRGRGRARPRRLDGRRAHATRGSCSRELRRADGRLLRSWQDGRAVPRVRRGLRRAARGAAHAGRARRRRVARRGARRSPTSCCACSPTTTAAASSPPAHDAEALVVRPKDFLDNATPSANSLAANGLLRLAALTGDPDGARRAERWLATLAPVLGEHPTAFAYLLEALERAVQPPLEVAIVGDDGPERDALVDVVRTRVLPGSVRVDRTAGVGAELTPLLADRTLVDGRPAAYVCEHFAVSCRSPTPTPSAPSSTGASTPSAEPEHDCAARPPGPRPRRSRGLARRDPASSSVTAAAAAAFAVVGRVAARGRGRRRAVVASRSSWASAR